jgi:hypothetical protein
VSIWYWPISGILRYTKVGEKKFNDAVTYKRQAIETNPNVKVDYLFYKN